MAAPPEPRPPVAIVDDDAGVRDSLSLLLRAAGYATRVFATAEAFLAVAAEVKAHCAVVDLRLPGINGLELQAELARRGSALPVIVITAHGDVASARAALRAGARDFIEKPIDNDDLLAALREVDVGPAGPPPAAMAGSAERLASLTAREREVFDRIILGLHNREIALELDISPRTVEVHRAHLMAKLEARRLADLLRLRWDDGAPIAPRPK